MTEKQIKMLIETINLMESCRKTIEQCCTKNLAPEDQEAMEANNRGNFPPWLPHDLCDLINQIWNLSEDMKYRIQKTSRYINNCNKQND
jgi:hypothetical protein